MRETNLEEIKDDVLIVDDDPSSLQTLSDMLLDHGYGVRRARDAQTALMIIKNAPPCLILLDVQMPEMNGYELCRSLKADERSCEIPVLFLSALDETENKIKGFNVGGVDYITKPFQVEEVLARVQTHMNLFKLQHQLEKQNEKLRYANEARYNAQSELKKSHEELEHRIEERTAELKETNLGLKNEISERKRTEEALNKTKNRLSEEIEEGKRREKEQRHTQKDLKKQLQFVELLSKLSAEFINLPFERIDKKIDQSFDVIAKHLGVERIALLQFSPDQSQLHLTHTYAIDPKKRAPIFLVSERLPWFTESLRQGKTLRISRMGDMPKKAAVEKQYVQEQGFKSFLTIPMKIDDFTIGAISYSSLTDERTWSDKTVQRFNLVSDIFTNALDRKRKDQELRNALSEIEQLKYRVEQENVYLKKEINLEHAHGQIIGKSEAIREVLEHVEQVAKTDASILIQGETGTGKELIAQAIHNISSRRENTMVKVNCAALPSTLIENELFGREKGAYTGALSKEPGRFEIADGSTIFLDEISELPLELQAKLLRVLQDGKFQRLGSSASITVDVRVIAATNRNLAEAVSEGSFRKDLFYRLNVFPINIPALRERKEDIPLLTWAFVDAYGKSMGKTVDSIPQKTMDALQTYAWPGNVRELKNIIERAIILGNDKVLNVVLPGIESQPSIALANKTLKEVEIGHILNVLDQTGWRVRGNNGAAEILGLKPSTLETRMAKHKIRRKK